jgi:hypothetical protein
MTKHYNELMLLIIKGFRFGFWGISDKLGPSSLFLALVYYYHEGKACGWLTKFARKAEELFLTQISIIFNSLGIQCYEKPKRELWQSSTPSI